MIQENRKDCPACGGGLKYYDKVPRIVRTKKRITSHITINRLKCEQCGVIHREIPEALYPYKQYEAEIINGVVEGFITPDILGFEDYPCEATMMRWIRMKNTAFNGRDS